MLYTVYETFKLARPPLICVASYIHQRPSAGAINVQTNLGHVLGHAPRGHRETQSREAEIQTLNFAAPTANLWPHLQHLICSHPPSS